MIPENITKIKGLLNASPEVAQYAYLEDDEEFHIAFRDKVDVLHSPSLNQAIRLADAFQIDFRLRQVRLYFTE